MPPRTFAWAGVLAALAAGAICQVAGPVGLAYVGTPSIPKGLYLANRYSLAPKVGEYVCISGASLPEWARQRHYLPAGMPLCKQVAALSGGQVVRSGVHQQACDVSGTCVSSTLRPVDSQGRSLAPAFPEGRSVIAADSVYLYSPHPRGLDSRYLGQVSASAITLRLTPLLTRGVTSFAVQGGGDANTATR
jgi:type IV secretory pathway protease TraF